MAIKYKQCPKCHSKNVVPIIYGYPSGDMLQQSFKGKMELGGCSVYVGAPTYYCKDCEERWSKQDIVQKAYGEIKRLQFSIGSFHQGEMKFVIDFEKGQATYYKPYEMELEEAVVKEMKDPNKELKKLIQIGLLKWKSRYVDEEIWDGEQWSLEIIRGGRTLKKYGSNLYPTNWDKFCYWLETTTVEDVFEREWNRETKLIDVVVNLEY